MPIEKLFPFLGPFVNPCKKYTRKRRDGFLVTEEDQKQIEKTLKGLDQKLDKVIKESGYNYPKMSYEENLSKTLMKSIRNKTEDKSVRQEFNIFGHGVQSYLLMIG